MDKRHIPLEKVVRHFEVHNRSEGKSPRTVEWYNEVLDLSLRWLGELGHGAALVEITQETVREFIIHLRERPGQNGSASTHTVNKWMRCCSR